MKVLIIDDSPEVIALVTLRLAREGLDVVCADCGKAGLEAVRHELPDLILLDVDMPDMSGFDVCRMLKADPELCMIPIVFLSGLDGAEDKVIGLNIGATDYVTKPFDAFELQARVNTALRAKYMQDLLTEHANIDPLTGLPNLRAMKTRLNEEWARVERHGRPLSFILAEVDRFDRINDTYGRGASDRVLQVTSETITSQCRQIDVPTKCGKAEFTIIVPDETAEDTAILAERCRNRISKMQLKVDGKEIWVTASFGVADAAGKNSVKDLTEAVCNALHQAKEAGGNRVVAEQPANYASTGASKP